MNKIQIPWEERPAGCTDVMWRYSKNPVIGRYQIPPLRQQGCADEYFCWFQ